jgi:uncharacterized membrane protein YczE
MTGLVARGVGSVRVVRTVIEVTVLAIGWMFGGIVGVGTIVYAVAIGPLLHVLLPKLQVSAVTEEQLEPVRVPADEVVEAAQAPYGEGEGR